MSSFKFNAVYNLVLVLSFLDDPIPYLSDVGRSIGNLRILNTTGLQVITAVDHSFPTQFLHPLAFLSHAGFIVPLSSLLAQLAQP